MRAEIIAIGTELTSGQKLDTNSQWLSTELASIGVTVHYHTTVADGLDEMVRVFQQAVQRSDLVLITGGLGPTLDDLTRQAMAQLADVQLVEDRQSLEHVQRLFASRGREMPERNRVQALFPEGSEPLPNPRGTAPGIWMTLPSPTDGGTSRLAALPGVPAEMKPMFQSHVLPRLPIGHRVIRRLLIHCFGAGESKVEELLGDMTARGRDPEVGITASQATITLRITAEGSAVEECQAKLQQAREDAEERLGKLVFGYGDDLLEDVVARLLAERRQTVAVCDTGTNGLLAQCLARVEPSSVFRGGVVLPRSALLDQFDATKRLADAESVDALPTHSAVAMAEWARERLSSDFGIAVADWTPAVGGVLSTEVAVVGEGQQHRQTITMPPDYTIHRSRTAKVAINLLRLHLLESSSGR